MMAGNNDDGHDDVHMMTTIFLSSKIVTKTMTINMTAVKMMKTTTINMVMIGNI